MSPVARGGFITLEGLEGVGKTSNLEVIVETLREAGIEPVQTREPGGTPLGEALRELLLDGAGMRAETELLLMAASRRELVSNLIEPTLESGRWVVSDRFLDASVAYQGGGRELGIERVEALHRLIGITLEPDLTLLLDLPIEVGLERAGRRGAPDRLERESLAFFERARSAYLERARLAPDRVRVIDAERTLGEVRASVADEVRALLTRRRGDAG